MRTIITGVLLFIFPLVASAQSATATVTPTPFPTSPPVVTPAAQQTIAIGDTINAAFPAVTISATYYFEGHAGQYISVALEIPLPYTRLRLLDDQGNELERGDFNVGRGMEIPFVELPKDGLYTIMIERSEGLDTFMLKLKNLGVEPIEYGQVIEGELSADETAKLYRFAGVRFDAIDVSVRSTMFDAYVMVHDDEGHNIASDDNGGGVRDAFIGLEYLFSTGDYLIYVSSKDGRSSGAFQLRLNRAEFKPLKVGDSLEVIFTQDSPVAYFEFEGATSDVINLTVQSGGTVDTMIQMADPDYTPGYTDDDSGDGFDPEIISWGIGKEGMYRILLRPYQIGSEGQVTLTLSRPELPSLDSGSLEIALTEKHAVAAVTFQGKAGEQMKLTVAADPLMENPPEVVVMQGNVVLANGTGIVDWIFAVPVDGPVVVEIRDSNSGPGIVHLSLEPITQKCCLGDI